MVIREEASIFQAGPLWHSMLSYLKSKELGLIKFLKNIVFKKSKKSQYSLNSRKLLLVSQNKKKNLNYHLLSFLEKIKLLLKTVDLSKESSELELLDWPRKLAKKLLYIMKALGRMVLFLILHTIEEKHTSLVLELVMLSEDGTLLSLVWILLRRLKLE